MKVKIKNKSEHLSFSVQEGAEISEFSIVNGVINVNCKSSGTLYSYTMPVGASVASINLTVSIGGDE